MTAIKSAEISGMGVVKPLDQNQQQMQNLSHGSKKQQRDAVGVRGSSGVTSSVHGYKDNDITAALVNSKHTNRVENGKRADHKPKQTGG